MPPKMLYVLHHLGLGDHFICNGMIRALRKQNPNCRLILLCKSANQATVRSMYADDPNIELLTADTPEQMQSVEQYANDPDCRVIKAGSCHNPAPTNAHAWDRVFYEHAEMDFYESYRSFKVGRNSVREEGLFDKLNPRRKDYIVINNLASNGTFNLAIRSPLLRIHNAYHTENLLDWLKIIENAHEVHTIDSAWLGLIDRLELPTTARLYYHTIRGTVAPTLMKDWITVNYESRWKELIRCFRR